MNGFSILDAALKSADFEILLCDCVRHDASWRERSSKPCCDFWILQEGSMRITYKKKTYALSAGDGFLLEPDTIYSAVGGGQGCKFIYVHFRARLGENPNVFSGYEIGGKTDNALITKEVRGFEDAFEAVREGQAMAQFSLKAALMQLCARAIALKETKKISAVRLEQILGYMDTHFLGAPSIPELAAKMNMSEKYFISYFKKHTGQTPHAYITAQRMQYAYAALHTPDVRVKSIAEKLGYCDAYAFSKAFKVYFGVAPAFAHKSKHKTKKIFGKF